MIWAGAINMLPQLQSCIIPAMQPLQQRRSGKTAQLGRLILSHGLLFITLQYINADLSCSSIAWLFKRESMSLLEEVIPKADGKIMRRNTLSSNAFRMIKISKKTSGRGGVAKDSITNFFKIDSNLRGFYQCLWSNAACKRYEDTQSSSFPE